MMKVLVIGQGGREHAIVKALAESPSVEKVYALPGNDGMREAQCLPENPKDFNRVAECCLQEQVDLVIVGPENFLADGLADELRNKNIPVFGPEKRAAQLEASKVVAKEFMAKYEVPTSAFDIVQSVADLKNVAGKYQAPFVLKADGLAGGKGVFICQDENELFAAGKEIFEDKKFGDAGSKAIIEQFQTGYEISYFVLTNGENYVSLPLAQDHKRLGNGDTGPNTGGMGTVAPFAIDAHMEETIIEKVVEPTVSGFKKEGFLYRGVVFIGLMITENGPQVLEYNIRFGDPETQVLMPMLANDWGEVMLAIAKGSIPNVEWKDHYAACVVLAAENYPASPIKGTPILGNLEPATSQYFLHAGTKCEGGDWFTNGGRVLNAIGLGKTKEEALQASYEQAKKIQWNGLQMRSDIGKQW